MWRAMYSRCLLGYGSVDRWSTSNGHRGQLAFELEARYDDSLIYLLLHAMLFNVASMVHFWPQRSEMIEYPTR